MKKMDAINSNESFVYLDYNATTPLAEEVISGIQQSLVNDWGNPSSFHPIGAKAKAAIVKARKQIADMLNCLPSEVIFTSGGTEANNMVVQSSVCYFNEHKRTGSRNKFGEKPHIITTNVEHDSVILPIKHLEEQSIVTYSTVKVNANGCVNVEDVLSKITDQTCLITIMHANNETGVIMPIPQLGKEISDINNERKRKQLREIWLHTDAAQIIGKENVNFQMSRVHFMTIVGHKFYGPKIGCIVARANLYPVFFGGRQENGLRPGTENTPMIVGLGIAAELVKINLERYRVHMLQCREKLESRLQEVFGEEVVINCEETERLANTSNIAFKTLGLEGNLVLSRCRTLIASIGSACHLGQGSQILINSGVPVGLAKNSIRLSIGRNTTLQEIEDCVLDLLSAVTKLKANQTV